MSRRLVLIFVPLLALQLSSSMLRASQNAPEAKQEVKKARPTPDTANPADPPAKDKASSASNPSPSARPAQPDSVKNPDSVLPAVSEKNTAAPSQPAESAASAPSAPVGTATLNIRIRTQDDSPFAGIANLRVVTHAGSELSGAKSASFVALSIATRSQCAASARREPAAWSFPTRAAAKACPWSAASRR